MKKIFYLFSFVVLGALLASCNNLNLLPVFDDDDAFAAFPSASMKIAEDGGVLNIPVHVSSLMGVATTVSYEFVNGSATQGVDFEDSANGTITFAAGESEKNIAVKIISHLGTFTGDRAFTVKLKSAGDVNMGASNTCSVTINDTDHPLAAILGTYTASSVADYWGDEYDFNVTLSKDASDVSKIWISNLDPYFASYGYTAPNYNYIYGVVNDDVTMITIPRLQAVGYESVVFNGLDDPDPDVAGAETDILIEIRDGGAKLVVVNAFGTYNAGDGFWSLYPGGLVLSK